MNRKDTILVAVLINLGVLLILFISSLKPHSAQEWQAVKEEQKLESHTDKIARVDNTKTEIKQETISKEFTQAINEIFKSDVKESSTDLAKSDNKSTWLEQQEQIKVVKSTPAIAEEVKRSLAFEEKNIPLQNTTTKNTQVQIKEKKQQLSDDHFYTVKNGDNPWTIATKNHIKVEELLKLNGLDDSKAKKIKPGDRLRIK